MVLFYSPPKKVVSSQKTVKLQVHGVDAFGQGIAHYKGKTVFIKNALPSEEVDAKLIEDKKQYAKAHVVKYYTKSEQRIAPQCQHYNVCGGCQMQHMSIDMQHAVKVEAFTTLFKKEASYSLAADDIKVISSNPYHYRRRARLAVIYENQRLVVGFRQQESNQIVDIKACPVLVNELEQLLLPLKNSLAAIKDKKALGHVELIHVDSGTIIVVRHVRPLSEKDTALLFTLAKNHHVSLYLHGTELVHVVGRQDHYYCIKQLKLTFSPLDFIQVNGEVNLNMVEQAIAWLALNQHDAVLDLFCGMGNFSLPMATLCQYISGVEGVAELVEKAKLNATLNRSQLSAQSHFYVSNLDNVDSQPTWYPEQINKVLLDPARPGAFQVMDKIVERYPSHVVYISCNPSTLVRDSKKLLQAGYTLAKASVLDMFPQTKHIESMLLFIKSGTK